MNRDQQEIFIKNLTSAIADELIEKIHSGSIPEQWDGIELREILAEKFSHETRSDLLFKPRGKRWKDYQNTIIVNNI
jgi:hypothetical protein